MAKQACKVPKSTVVDFGLPPTPQAAFQYFGCEVSRNLKPYSGHTRPRTCGLRALCHRWGDLHSHGHYAPPNPMPYVIRAMEWRLGSAGGGGAGYTPSLCAAICYLRARQCACGGCDHAGAGSIIAAIQHVRSKALAATMAGRHVHVPPSDAADIFRAEVRRHIALDYRVATGIHTLPSVPRPTGSANLWAPLRPPTRSAFAVKWRGLARLRRSEHFSISSISATG